MIRNLIFFILNIDKYISIIIQNFGSWVYLIFFVFVFCETGLVVVPFLPGDSLLFASGAFAAKGSLDIRLVYIVFAAAAIIGDTANYEIGRFLGPKVFSKNDSRFFKKEHLDRTHKFYEKYGGATIIIARFMPIIRTFAPFVAGIGKMRYVRFLLYNMIGGILWVSTFVLSGYYFGNIPFIRDNFSIVIYTVILISLLPAVIGFLKTGKVGEYLKNTYAKLKAYVKEIISDKALLRYIFTGIILCVISICVFVEIAEDCVVAISSGLDASAANYIHSIRSEMLDNIFKLISSSGGFIPIAAISIITAAVLFYYRKRKDAVFFMFDISGIWLLNELLTYIFKRERPQVNQIVYASGYSFPSSGAMIFMGLSFFIVYFLMKYLKNKKIAYVLSIFIFIYSVIVGLSGVYVGINYFSDVIAGWSAAILWITISAFMIKFINRNNGQLSFDVQLQYEREKK